MTDTESHMTSADPQPIIHGAPCWIDLATPDVDATMRFYYDVFGWKYTEHTDRIFAVDGDAPIAQISPIPDELSGVPSFWHVYFASEPLSRLIDRPGARSGELAAGPLDIDGLGRVVSVVDPSGAGFSLWEPTEFAGFPESPALPVWFELHTTDPMAVVDFYQELLDLLPAVYDTEAGAYRAFTTQAGDPVVGVVQATTSLWIPHIRVDDIDATIDRARTAGATVSDASVRAHPLGRSTLISDVTGAVVGIIEPSAQPAADDQGYAQVSSDADDNAGYPSTLTL
ncbi:VOC family protein [Gordonia sputi]|uniref:VOC family protein n=1 Tax=Gordonia sputi TaxID=36823 RepID=UPI0020443011|nr:VOC family protein [Gordonia sputi]MCM3898037.1 VOC family protein [Gordonia sputi]